jgi:hypothetical protein
MKIIHKNEGAYVDYSLNGSLLSFRSSELTLDLAQLERDYPVSITISEDETGRLIQGVSRRYIAELELPARRSFVEKTGVADDFGFPVLRRVSLAFSADNAALTLWALKGAD